MAENNDMEKLEKKIEDIIYESTGADEYFFGANIAASSIASEVKDIAIAFAQHYDKSKHVSFEDEFSLFISNYYK